VCSYVGICLKIICILAMYYFNADSKDDQNLDWSVGLVIVCFSRLHVDGSAVPKFVGFDCRQGLYFVYI
jgi:hypothetical protein